MKREKLRQDSGKVELTEMVSASDTIDEAQFKLRELARPPVWSDTRQASLGRVARILGITTSQARRIVYRELTRIDAHVLENIRIHYARLEARAERMADEQANIQRALKREIEGRDDAALVDRQGIFSPSARKPAGA
jgi:hypothetical protein